MSAVAEDLARIDLGDLALWEPEPPYELFARLRREAPAHWSPYVSFPDAPGFWSITRAADLAEVGRDFETFSSERGGIFLITDIGIPLEVQQQQMISMDPPRHDRVRAIVQAAFTPRRVAGQADPIREIVGAVFDDLGDRQEFDLVQDVAVRVPARVIGSMVGTPPADDLKLVEWTNVFTGFEDPAMRPKWEDAQESFMEAYEYVMAMLEARRREPTDDLLNALLYAEVDGDRLTDVEILTFFLLLVVAGNDSTRAVYSSGQLALMRDPSQRQMLLDDPSLIPNAIEESLRCFPAFGYMARTATKDVELHGQTIREGDRLALWYISGNRDETVFEDPERFDLTRKNVGEHQAFGGGGRHFCLGSNLARLELNIWLEETLRRFPQMELAGEPVRSRNLFINQQRLIPVRLP